MKFITFSKGWDGMPIAYHLQLEGEDSIVAQIQDDKELNLDGDSKEEPDDKRARLSQYDGMIKKYSAPKMLEALLKVKNKDDYFIFLDQNNLFEYGEKLLKAGFTKGLFPLKEDYEFEKDREKAMDFVDSYYPDVKIIPHQIAKTVEEAKKMIEESDKPLVLQSKGDFVPTICPVDDVEMNHTELLGALDKYAKDYAKGEIVLKEKLIDPIEITPQIVFYNGQPVFTDIDIETKNIGDGNNNGNQVGCGTNLIVKTEFEDQINKIAFPRIVYKMAEKRTGIFVWDISLYFTKSGIYFGEFCSNRFGYDALMTEMCMSGGASAYFNAIISGKNPLNSRFGAALRVFNLNRQADVEINVKSEDYIWLYEVKKEDKMVSLGDCWDLGVVTGEGNIPNEAIETLYKNYDDLSFKEKYARSKDDFLSLNYITSIASRYTVVNHAFFEAPDFETVKNVDKSVSDLYASQLEILGNVAHDYYDGKIKEMNAKHEEELNGVKEELKSIING